MLTYIFDYINLDKSGVKKLRECRDFTSASVVEVRKKIIRALFSCQVWIFRCNFAMDYFNLLAFPEKGYQPQILKKGTQIEGLEVEAPPFLSPKT